MIYKAGQVSGGSNPFSDNGRSIIHGLMARLTEFTEVNLGGGKDHLIATIALASLQMILTMAAVLERQVSGQNS